MDHEEKIVYVISVPLDEITIGNNTICIPFGISKIANVSNNKYKILVEVFENPKSSTGSVPKSNLNQSSYEAINQSFNSFTDIEFSINQLTKLQQNTQILDDK